MWKEFRQSRVQTGIFVSGATAGRDLVSTFFRQGADGSGHLAMYFKHGSLFGKSPERFKISNRTMNNKSSGRGHVIPNG